MNEIAKEARFMGTVTAVTMHEMQNIPGHHPRIGGDLWTIF